MLKIFNNDKTSNSKINVDAGWSTENNLGWVRIHLASDKDVYFQFRANGIFNRLEYNGATIWYNQN